MAIEPTRYSLRCGIEVFPAPDGDVYLLRLAGGDEFRVRSPSAEDRELLEALSSGPLEVPRDSWQADRLAPLVDAGVVVAYEGGAGSLQPGDATRFSRQLSYLGEIGTLPPEGAQRRLREACVVLIGAGGTGTWTVSALACLGIGRLILVDDDTVELSNLNRQVLFRSDDVGAAKVDAAAAWIGELDRAIETLPLRKRINAPEDVAHLLPGADVVIVAADSPPYELERWVNAACLEARVPFLAAGQRLPVVRIGPTYVPGVGPCLECQERRLREQFALYDSLTRYRQEHGINGEPALAPGFGIVGSVLALETMHLILGVTPLATQGRALVMNLRTLETWWEGIDRDPACPLCAGLESWVLQ